MRRILRGSAFIANFGLAKVAIYLAPLAIASFASAEIYGLVEFGQALTLLIAALVVGAPLSGITQQYIVDGDKRAIHAVRLTLILGCGAALVATGVTWLAGLPEVVPFVAAAFGISVIHNCLSTVGRTLGARNFTAWADGTAVLLALVAVTVLMLGRWEETAANLTVVFAAINLLAILGAALRVPEGGWRAMWAILRSAHGVGLPMVMFGIVSMWVGVGGRISVGFLAPSFLAAYGVAFRIAGLTLGIHQLLQTAFFARLYGGHVDDTDRLTAPFLAMVGVASVGLALLAGPVVALLGLNALEPSAVPAFRAILPATCLHVFVWIATAGLQVKVNSSGLSGRAIKPIAAITVIGAGLIFGLGHFLDIGIVAISWLLAVHAACYFVAAWLLLDRAGHRFVRVGTVFCTGVALLGVVGIAAPHFDWPDQLVRAVVSYPPIADLL